MAEELVNIFRDARTLDPTEFYGDNFHLRAFEAAVNKVFDEYSAIDFTKKVQYKECLMETKEKAMKKVNRSHIEFVIIYF